MVIVRSLSAGIAVLISAWMLTFFTSAAARGQTTQPAVPGNAKATDSLIYHLSNVDATRAADVVSDVLKGPAMSPAQFQIFSAIADPRTNSIALASDGERIAAARRLLEQLDQTLSGDDRSRKADDEETRLQKMESELQTLLDDVKSLRNQIEASSKLDHRQSAADPAKGPESPPAPADQPNTKPADQPNNAAIDEAITYRLTSTRISTPSATPYPLQDLRGMLIGQQPIEGVRPEAKPWSGVDERALLRRVILDLTGVPPTPEQLDKYLGKDDQNDRKQ